METRGRKPNDGRGRLGGRQKGTPNRRHRKDTIVSYLRADRPERRGRKADDGRGRLGGRSYETPNRITVLFDDFVLTAVTRSPEEAADVLRRMTPRDRAFVLLKVIGLFLTKPRRTTWTEAMEETDY